MRFPRNAGFDRLPARILAVVVSDVAHAEETGTTPQLPATVTAVVVTYRRPAQLAACLQRLAMQTQPPHQVIVIDNDPEESAEHVVSGMNLDITYRANHRNSLTVGRNLGSEMATGDYVVFVDDDVLLPSEYLARMSTLFSQHPALVGLQGHIVQPPRSRITNALRRVFRLYHVDSNSCKGLRSVSTSYPLRPRGLTSCEWISGSNQIYRRDVLDTEPWDSQMITYCDGEDLDHSIRLGRRFQDGLAMVGDLPVQHDVDEAGRQAPRDFILMREAYGYYLSHKLYPNSAAARLIFVWARIGIALETLVRAVRESRTSEARDLCRAYMHVFRNRTALRSGNLGSTNSLLLGRPDAPVGIQHP